MTPHELFFKSVNPTASRTLLLLHGAVSSHHEWDNVAHHLSSYHLLIPDLPSHGQHSSSPIPLTLENTASLLKDLIANHAHDGKADLVGMSLGGYTAIYLAQKHPELIGDLFISGVGQSWPKPGTWTSSANASVMFLSSSGLTSLPKGVFDWISTKAGLSVHEGLYADMKARASYQLTLAVLSMLGEDGDENWNYRFERVGKRSVVVAGVLDDGEEACRERGKQLRVGNEQSMAFKVEGMRHAWDLQDPDLFAEGIKAWMEEESMPERFVLVDSSRCG
ncbi:Alpha/Beta hydrolase protein [Amylocarpus encephaloides]|uniref:Alpha/Beta hydrolase protein n=1 Tax=Amylocarpus encephaloides TaxID=45428 RepID=A0A9P7YMZ8_9HELO|nr:Alpha/Beta hydrolase protein [Amylocarpus encephaloides]